MTEAKKRNGWWKQVAKYAVGGATAFAAAYAALRPEEVARRALYQIQESHRDLSTKVVNLQRWARSNRDRSKSAEATCKADVKSLSQFVAGFLEGQQSSSRRPARNKEESHIKDLIKALAAKAPVRTKSKALPKLAPPVKYEQIKKGGF